MFLLKYARGFFEKKMVVVGVAILLVLVLLYNSGYLGGRDNRTRIACVGDSLTYGSGVLKTREINSYPSKLQQKLGTTYYVMNYGLRNATASADGDLPYLSSDEYAQSLESNPDVVILMLGTNDSKIDNWNADSYREGLTEIVNSYLELESDPTVYIMRSPYCYSIDGGEIAEYTIQPAVVENEIGTIIKTVADESGVNYIDLYTPTDGQDELYTKDGIHFNKNGYELIASIIHDAIK